jgi:indole-3-glycerol phosphate synthase
MRDRESSPVSQMPSVLAEIVAYKREEVAAGKAARPRFALEGLPPARGFAAAIGRAGSGASRDSQPLGPVRLIAEVKHASPVKGVLRADFDPVALARTYAENGAAAISVLTDERFFQGHPDYLRQIREVVPVPLLRKEFIIDEWQLAESCALGADALLLIVAILSHAQLRDYLQVTYSLGMDALVEVHTEGELEVALASGARIIGVNNRDLHTFVTDLAVTERFAPRVKEPLIRAEVNDQRESQSRSADGSATPPRERLLVSESGISSAADVARLAATGVDAILVGEALVREPDVAAKVRELAGFVTI